MKRLRIVPTVVVLLASLPFTLPAQAAWQIRVLLYQNIERVEVSADSDLQVRLPGGPVWVVSPSLVFTSLSGTVQVNGKHLPGNRVVVKGGTQDVRVWAKGHTPRKLSKEGPPRRTAVFGKSLALASLKEARVAKPSPPRSRSLVVGGDLRIISDSGGLTIINSLDLEEYVQGVVPAEMNAGWHLEALKTQAVAARTYALYQQMVHSDRDYDLVATIQDQVYRGRSGVDDRVKEAVKATAGRVLTYQDRPIFAAFSSTAAGPTEDVVNVWSKDLPYLKGVDCPFDKDSPYFRWMTAFGIDTLENQLKQQGYEVGTIATVTPYSYSRAGRVARVRILNSLGELILRGEDLRRVVGYRVIPSTRFTIEAVGKDVVLSGYGAGHAVGLCQWGTKELAELGYSYEAILQYYFPGAELQRAWRMDPMAGPSS